MTCRKKTVDTSTISPIVLFLAYRDADNIWIRNETSPNGTELRRRNDHENTTTEEGEKKVSIDYRQLGFIDDGNLQKFCSMTFAEWKY